MNRLSLCVATLSTSLAVHALAVDNILGSAQWFGVLAGSTATNTGQTTVVGDLGVWPGLAVTGFPPGRVVAGSIYHGGPVAQQAQADITTAYNLLVNMPHTATLSAIDLGGMTLTPGVYFFESSASLNGTLTLNALGDQDARFVFQIGSTLTTSSNAAVLTINSADAHNVFWQVGSSATLGSETAFQGNILAMASITLNTGATLGGAAFARTGAVTLDSNPVNAICSADFDRDGTVDFFDYDAFVVAFEAGNPRSDFDGDGSSDFFDYDLFVQAFEHGC
ncbi:MAG: ice-binding family protein [Planctomycetota bacterium]|mgnify:CR=1 FL=1